MKNWRYVLKRLCAKVAKNIPSVVSKESFSLARPGERYCCQWLRDSLWCSPSTRTSLLVAGWYLLPFPCEKKGVERGRREGRTKRNYLWAWTRAKASPLPCKPLRRPSILGSRYSLYSLSLSLLLYATLDLIALVSEHSSQSQMSIMRRNTESSHHRVMSSLAFSETWIFRIEFVSFN